MPFILVNHDSFISDGPVLVKLQVDGFDDIGIGLDVGFLAVRPETDAAAVTENVKNQTPKKARGDRRDDRYRHPGRFPRRRQADAR
jgi:hypothetical protein